MLQQILMVRRAPTIPHIYYLQMTIIFPKTILENLEIIK